jgi:predicted DNA-binding transcriptional regulator AlpA
MSALQTARLASVGAPTETPALQLGDILTIQQVADLLQFSKRQVYELTRARGQGLAHPIPLLRINGNIRFRRRDIETWIDEQAVAA